MTCGRRNINGNCTSNFIGLHLPHQLGTTPTFSWTPTQPKCTSMSSIHNSIEEQQERGVQNLARPHDPDLEEYVNELVPALHMINKSTHTMDISHRQEAIKLTADALLARRATGMAWSDALRKGVPTNYTHILAHDQENMGNFKDLSDLAVEDPDYMNSMECASSSCIRTPVSSEGTNSCELSEHDFSAFHHGSTASLASSDHSSMVDSTSELMQDDMDALNYVQSGITRPLMEIACSSDAAQRSNVSSSGDQLLHVHGDSQLVRSAASDELFKEINARLIMIRSCCKGLKEDAERTSGPSDAAIESLNCLQVGSSACTREEEAANVNSGNQDPTNPEAHLERTDDVAGSLSDEKDACRCMLADSPGDEPLEYSMVDVMRQHGSSWNMDDKHIMQSDGLYADPVHYGNVHGVDGISYAISHPRHASHGFPYCTSDNGDMGYPGKLGDVGVSHLRNYHFIQYGHRIHGFSQVSEAHHELACGHADVAHQKQMHDDVAQPAQLPFTDVAHSGKVFYDMACSEAHVGCNAAQMHQHDMACGGGEVSILPLGSRTDMMPGKQSVAFYNADVDQGGRGRDANDEVGDHGRAASDGAGDEPEVHAADVDVKVNAAVVEGGGLARGGGGSNMRDKDDVADVMAHESEVYAEVDRGGRRGGSHSGNNKMRETMYRVAAYQPIDWGSIMEEVVGKQRPKRKNVRISKEPQSVAARRRRERISDRIHILQRLVPGATKLDTASMLDEAIHYLKFLKLQVQALHRLDKYFTSSLRPLATNNSSSHLPTFQHPPSACPFP